MTGHEQHWARSDPATVGTDPAGAAALPVTLEQPFTVADLYALRAAVSAHADAAELPPLIVDTLLIITGELSSNVVRHGGGTGRLTLRRSGEDIIVQVSDDGPGIADPGAAAGRAPALTGAPSGRGLWLVRQLSRHRDIVADPRGTTVTAAVAVGEAEPAADAWPRTVARAAASLTVPEDGAKLGRCPTTWPSTSAPRAAACCAVRCVTTC